MVSLSPQNMGIVKAYPFVRRFIASASKKGIFAGLRRRLANSRFLAGIESFREEFHDRGLSYAEINSLEEWCNHPTPGLFEEQHSGTMVKDLPASIDALEASMKSDPQLQEELKRLKEALHEMPSESLLRGYAPQEGWFLYDPKGIHGIAHVTRVLVLSALVGGCLAKGGQEIDLDALRWAAGVHDVRRIHDGIDNSHGKRSADWFMSELAHVKTDRNKVCYAVMWHHLPDARAPAMTAELKALKDADGLDRWRLGDLDPDFLRTQAAKEMLNISRYLHAISEALERDRGVAQQEAVFKAAKMMGIIR